MQVESQNLSSKSENQPEIVGILEDVHGTKFDYIKVHNYKQGGRTYTLFRMNNGVPECTKIYTLGDNPIDFTKKITEWKTYNVSIKPVENSLFLTKSDSVKMNSYYSIPKPILYAEPHIVVGTITGQDNTKYDCVARISLGWTDEVVLRKTLNGKNVYSMADLDYDKDNAIVGYNDWISWITFLKTVKADQFFSMGTKETWPNRRIDGVPGYF